ncbi:MAG: HU family DNA-binding protein [Candidatus Pacebacteria bacterium]|nr:HU family DNA-binding protein [Candidatus Paceibacterota bacterium]MDD3808654.1 HU family DNA-binding protein [Candidatus Paceibacterota bacterium]
MKKDNLVELVQEQLKSTKKDAENVVALVFDSISKSLKKGEEAAISGFGTFTVKTRAARMGVNPKTGEKIHIAAKKVAKFRPAKALKDMIA